MQLYDKGVYYEPDCSGSDLNHAMLVVGYGSDPKLSDDNCNELSDHWIVKNR
jgi:cathepsin L